MTAVILWAAVFAAIVVLEGLGLTLRGHDWPTISDMFRAATRPAVGRWIFFALWLWAGWHFFIRGWHFFLRGSGASEPGHGPGGGKTAGQIITQVVLPLVVLYGMLAAVLAVGYRSWRQGRTPSRASLGRGAPRVFARPLAFIRYSAATTLMGYAVFVAVIALYALLAGHSAHGILGSAAKYGAFLAFAVALPLFCALSFAEGFVRSRRRRTGDMMSDDLH